MKLTVPSNSLEISVNVNFEDLVKARPLSEILAGMDSEHQCLFRATTYFVEADREMVYHLQLQHKDRQFSEKIEATYTIDLGSICDRPVTLTLQYQKVLENMICFYEIESQLAYWPLAEDFIKQAAPTVQKTNAANIHHIFSNVGR